MEKEKILSVIKIFAILFSIFFIILSGKNLYDKKHPPIIPCTIGSTDFDCYSNYYTAIVKRDGVEAAFKKLKEDYSKNQYILSQCHPMSHVIGHAAVFLYPEISEAFKHGDPFCWSGYYHGVMEETVERVGLEKINSELDNICAKIPGKESYSFDYYNCVHGLGHGVMSVNENELFKSLKMCDNLSGVWEKQSCYGGVYMENVIIDNKGEYTPYLKPEEPLYPCTAVDTPYKSACYLMQTSYALKVNNYDFNKIFPICRKSDKGFEDICYQSIGRDASGNTSSNIEGTTSRCDLGQNFEEKSNCYIGAVKDFISYYHSDVEAKKLCNSLNQDLKDVCLSTAVSYYSNF